MGVVHLIDPEMIKRQKRFFIDHAGFRSHAPPVTELQQKLKEHPT